MTDTKTPEKKTKTELEQFVKSNGGQIFQTHTAAPNTVCIADRSAFSPLLLINRYKWNLTRLYLGTVKVASIQKSGSQNIIRPIWLFDCIKQTETDNNLPTFLLPFEPRWASQRMSLFYPYTP